MKNSVNKKPVVLVLAGHDPVGGAGIQADIEAIGNNGCHAATIITCMTIQNTMHFEKTIAVNANDFRDQIRYVLDDMTIAACKIGIITDIAIMDAIESALKQLGPVPVILDPVINAGTGDNITKEEIFRLLHKKIIPLSTIITPNINEVRDLTGENDIQSAATILLDEGCQAVLVTGTHEKSEQVNNLLYQKNVETIKYTFLRLSGEYHGSGCTLSAAIAAQMAKGNNTKQAVEIAQDYTWHTLQNGLSLGQKQYHPDRYYKGI